LPFTAFSERTVARLPDRSGQVRGQTRTPGIPAGQPSFPQGRDSGPSAGRPSDAVA
jgi:hypothetical protein